MRVLVFSTLLTLIICGCSPSRYSFTSNAKNEIVKSSYSSKDTFLLNDFILCNFVGNVKGWKVDKEIKSVNSDSVMDFFYEGLKKLELPFIIKTKNNHCDSTLDFVFPLKIEAIDSNRIIEIASFSKNSKFSSMIPVIRIDDVSQRAMFISSRGMPGGGYYMRDTFLYIVVYIIKNNEIIYLKSARYGPVSSDTANPDEEPPLKLEQEHWDKLVELVMQDYIKGVNRYKEQNNIFD